MPGRAPAHLPFERRHVPRRSLGRGLVRSALLGVFVAVLALLASGTDLLRSFELRTVDLRFRLRGEREVRAPLAVVFIDDASIAAFGRWPWSWDYHALLVDALHRAGARLVLFDVLFAEAPSRVDALMLAGAVRKAGNVHFISYFDDLDPPGEGEVLMAGRDLTECLPELRRAAAGHGHANATPDMDGTRRRIPLLVRTGQGVYPAAALGVAAGLLGVRLDQAEVRPGGEIRLRPAAGPEIRIPIDADGMTAVNFAGGIDAFPVRYSFRQVLEADLHPDKAAVDLAALRDRVVLVGATFTGNTDLQPAPFAAAYPMMFVQGTVIDNVLGRRFLRRPPTWFSFGACLLLGALLGVLTFTFQPLASLALTGVAGAAYAGLSVLAFTRWDRQVELVAPLVAILAAYVLVTTAEYVETRKEKNRAIERLKYLGHLVESAAEAIFSIGPDGRIASWNGGAARVFGRGEREVRGRHWTLLATDGSRAVLEGALARLEGGGDAKNIEVELTRGDGDPIPAEVSFSSILDSSGRVVGVSAICEDLTEKKRMLELLIRSEKLAEIGRMGSGIVHEIKNPLTSIMMMSDIIHATEGLPEKTLRYAEIIQKESQRILRLSQNILSFARPRKPEMRPTDLAAVLADTLGLVEYELKKAKVRPEERYDPTAPPVLADGEKLKQVFLNLVVNAAHAMEGGGSLVVSTVTGAGPADSPEPGWASAAVGDAPAGPSVTARIEDRGQGIPDGMIERIFEPFFSTKGEGKGTGLGLYISRNIVLEHRGRIAVASRPGAGTVFSVTLPAGAATPATGASS